MGKSGYNQGNDAYNSGANGGGPTTDEKVKASATDVSNGFLFEKLAEGANIQLNVIDSGGGVEKVEILANVGTAGEVQPLEFNTQFAVRNGQLEYNYIMGVDLLLVSGIVQDQSFKFDFDFMADDRDDSSHFTGRVTFAVNRFDGVDPANSVILGEVAPNYAYMNGEDISIRFYGRVSGNTLQVLVEKDLNNTNGSILRFGRVYSYTDKLNGTVYRTNQPWTSGAVPADAVKITQTTKAGGIIQTGAGADTFSIGVCETKSSIPNVNNQGAVCATLMLNTKSFVCRSLSCFISQAQTSNPFVQMAIYDPDTLDLLAYTLPFAPVNDENIKPLVSEIELMGSKLYYMAIFGTNQINSTQFFGKDAGIIFGNSGTYLGLVRDNVTSLPNNLSGAPETSQRFYIAALTA